MHFRPGCAVKFQIRISHTNRQNIEKYRPCFQLDKNPPEDYRSNDHSVEIGNWSYQFPAEFR